MKPLSVSFVQLPHGAGLPAPAYESANASGVDLSAAVPENAPVVLAPGERAAIPTGLQLAIPQGYEGQVRPRSGLALKHAVTVLNAASPTAIAARTHSAALRIAAFAALCHPLPPRPLRPVGVAG